MPIKSIPCVCIQCDGCKKQQMREYKKAYYERERIKITEENTNG